jgi:clan AA aspartic protease
MIVGFVNPNWKAEIRLILLNQQEQEIEFSVFVDSGFNGSLALPHSFLEQINAEPLEDAVVLLADGSAVILPTFAVKIKWDNEPKLVEAFATTGDPILGMRLLENHELKIEVRIGGEVKIELLS